MSDVLQKFGKNEKEQHQAQNRGMLTLEQGGWSDILNDCKSALHNIGIPVQSKDQTQVNNQFRFNLRKVPNDLLGQCDMFHIAKHAMKFVAFSHEYDISNLPIDSSGVVNDLIMCLEGSPDFRLHESQLQNVLYFAPNVNSIRRIKVSTLSKLSHLEKEKRIDLQRRGYWLL